jgi:hypothetical protein
MALYIYTMAELESLSLKELNKLAIADKKAAKKKKRDKKKAKKYIPKLPNKVIVIKNNMKDVGGWMERYGAPKNRSIACLPHPFRLCALGGVGRGKTNMLKQIFLAHQSTKRPFRELYIITCDLASTEFLDLEPTGILDEIPDMSLFNPKLKTCCIIDDYEMSRASTATLRRLSTLFRFVSSHKNVSLMVGYQVFFECPSVIRKCSNVFLLYKPVAVGELTMIANRVGLAAVDLHMIFDEICTGVYDCLMVDHIPGSPFCLRKNLYEEIKLATTNKDGSPWMRREAKMKKKPGKKEYETMYEESKDEKTNH